jgi:hypothetical protein
MQRVTVVIEISTCHILVTIYTHLQIDTALSIYTYNSQDTQLNCCYYMHNNQSQQWSVYTHCSFSGIKNMYFPKYRNLSHSIHYASNHRWN